MYYLRSFLDLVVIRVGAILLLVALSISTWTGFLFSSATSNAKHETQSLAVSKDLLAKLDTIRGNAMNVQDHKKSSQETIAIVRQGLSFAGISEKALEDLRFGQVSPVPATTLLKDEVAIELGLVSVQQMMNFISFLENIGSLGACTAIRLTLDSTEEAREEEKWDAQLTLTRLTRSAKSASGQE